MQSTLKTGKRLPNVRLICLLILSLAVSGCQCLSGNVDLVKRPAPPAWMMEQFEPNLTPRMVHELSASPETETERSAP